MSPNLSYLSESGKPYNKKPHWQEQWPNSSQRYIFPWNTEEVYQQLLNSKRTVQPN